MNRNFINYHLLISNETRQEFLTSLILAIITIVDLVFIGVITVYYLVMGDASGYLFFIPLGIVSGAGWILSRFGYWRWVSRIPVLFFFFLGIYGSVYSGLTTYLVVFYLIAFMLAGLLNSKYEMVFIALMGLIIHVTISLLTFEYNPEAISAVIVLAAGFTGVLLLQCVYVTIAGNVFTTSLTDSLSQTFNRSYFDATIEVLQKRHRGPISILMADIDGLKNANDSLGHAYGDLLIIRAAQCLRAACRDGDVVCRIGGDEFALLFTNIDEKVLGIIVERLFHIIESNNQEYPEFSLSLSVGTATTRHPGELPEIYKLADARMYEQKMEKRQAG